MRVVFRPEAERVLDEIVDFIDGTIWMVPVSFGLNG